MRLRNTLAQEGSPAPRRKLSVFSERLAQEHFDIYVSSQFYISC
ncbi:hypothetical protein [Oceanobacillus chungangensis]|nr:hypothetical protein [Oceanobacillus chungangensis]